MNDIFGIPLSAALVVLAIALALCLISVGWVAWRRPVIFKLGARNIPRRKAQTALIVVGLMLSTLIMAAALGTGDTVTHSVTSVAYDRLGHVDELVIISEDVDASGREATSELMDPAALTLVEQALAGASNVDGIMPVLGAHVSVVNETAQQAEPQVQLTGLDPAQLDAFGGLQSADGSTIDLGALAAGEFVIGEQLAEDLEASQGDLLSVYWNGTPHQLRVAAIAEDTFVGGTAMPLAHMQALTNQPGGFNTIAVSNDGGVRGSEAHSDAVEATLHEALAGHGLGVDPAKEVAVDQAENVGNMITTIFVLLGSFSVMAGVLLIILIFTMLASERRAEMGMERAIGTQRRQLIQQFVSEGAGYAVVAGLVGALFGVLAVFGIAEGMNYIFGAEIPVEAKVNPRSMLLAYCLGTVITFVTVVIASWKISRLNVVAAIRDIPEIATRGRRKSTLLWGSLLTVFGGLLTLLGSSGSQAALFATGMSLLPFGVAILLRFFRMPGRPVFSLLGAYLLVFWLLPESTFSDLFGEFEFGIEMFFLSGMFMVVGATILIMQNTDVLLAGVNKLGRLFRSKLPAVRTAVAYPSAARGRTGMTIAMFSLIIFSLVMMATMNQNYIESALGDESNAGWDVRGDTYAANAPADLIATLQDKGVDTSGFAAVGLVTNPNGYTSKLRLAGTDEWKNWEVLGVDQAFLEHSTLKFGQRAAGYETDADVIAALSTQANVAVIHADVVPVEGNLGEDKTLLALEGLKSSDASFEPIKVELANPRDGSAYVVTIIGVLDGSIGSLTGLYTNQATIDTVYPITTRTSYYVALDDEAQSAAVAKQIEAALLQEGVQGIDIRDELKELQKQESGFLYIIEGFMALGLFVGVAAVGVIAFRTVVERRQQIGMLRALGYSRELVSLSFMIETLFVVGLGVLTGTTLGILLSRNLVMDPDQGFSPDISFVIPWAIILPIVVLTIGVALLMTWIPARQAGRITPAEALRYE